MSDHRRCLLVCLVLVLPVCAGGLEAQQIRDPTWGFDGTVHPGTFNLLSAVVHNDSDQPFEDDVVASRALGLTRVGAPVAQRVYVAPRTNRIVQFPVFVGDLSESWSLRFGASRLRETGAPALRSAEDVVVMLEPSPDLQDPIDGIPGFPARMFPTSLGVTDPLRDVVLDHVPSWDPLRRRVFLDWLRGGGRLHLLTQGSGELRFEDDLAVLNLLDDAFTVGAGSVLRYRRPRTMISRHTLRLSGARATPLERRQRDPQEQVYAEWNAAPVLLRGVQLQVDPQHDWGPIFLCSFMFFLLVGPGHWLLAHRRVDYRLSILYLVAVIGAFTWLFVLIGARGYDEQASMHTIGLAKRLEAGRYDVVQYSNVFVTSGGGYRLTRSGETAMLSAGSVREPVDGTIRNGKDASFVVDIPLFSSRTCVHRASLPGPDFGVEVVHWPGRKEATSPEFLLTGDRPRELRSFEWIQEGKVWSLQLRGDRLVPAGSPRTLSGRFDPEQIASGQAVLEEAYPLPNRKSGSFFDKVLGLRDPLLAQHLRVLTREQRQAWSDRALGTLLCAAPAPDSFRLGGAPGNEESLVFYRIDLYPPEDD